MPSIRPSGDRSPEDDSVSYFVSHQNEIEGRRRHWSRRVMPGIGLAGSLLLTLLILPGALLAHGAANQSQRTQAHGFRELGSVTAVVNTTHSHLSADTGYAPSVQTSWYDAKISIDLLTSVNGHETTTAYAPQRSSLVPGTSVTVLLDPKHVGYAELPGQPLWHGAGWIVLAVLAAAVIVADLVFLGIVVWPGVRRRLNSGDS